ncbi:MAG: NAD-dependent epimerase/dehydratase [Bryobacterales bacterium]|nr:NAD-dependent epimerase/dehydratase [Bryobacterales bacterium]
MAEQPFSVITGAYGFTGKYIARGLLAKGESVVTLTGNPGRPNEFGNRVKTRPLRFDDPGELESSLRGAHVLYNSYWVRFDYGERTFSRAVENTRVLIGAAERAGVKRIVHISITNPSLDSPLPYFRGKALLEQTIKNSGLEYAILRPAVIFGLEDILINNIAFFLRKFPLFAVPGNGEYELQPIFVDDLARLAVDAASAPNSFVADAVGPERFRFNDLVAAIARSVGSRTTIIHAPATLVLGALRVLGSFLGDVILTRDEVSGLLANLLISADPPSGTTRLTDWLRENAATVGLRYSSEVQRHYK